MISPQKYKKPKHQTVVGNNENICYLYIMQIKLMVEGVKVFEIPDETRERERKKRVLRTELIE